MCGCSKSHLAFLDIVKCRPNPVVESKGHGYRSSNTNVQHHHVVTLSRARKTRNIACSAWWRSRRECVCRSRVRARSRARCSMATPTVTYRAWFLRRRFLVTFRILIIPPLCGTTSTSIVSTDCQYYATERAGYVL